MTEGTFTIGGKKMIDYVLAQGSALRPRVAAKIIGDLTNELYKGHPASALGVLLNAEVPMSRAIGAHVAYMAGPYAKDVLGDVERLTTDEDAAVKKAADQVVRQAIAAGWIRKA